MLGLGGVAVHDDAASLFPSCDTCSIIARPGRWLGYQIGMMVHLLHLLIAPWQRRFAQADTRQSSRPVIFTDEILSTILEVQPIASA
jgi:hypothetical protein